MVEKDIKKNYKEPKEPIKLLLELIWLTLIFLPVVLWSFVQKFREQKRKSLKGEVVLISGSGNGLGREIAMRLAEKGCRLALVDINEEAVNEVRKEINDRRPDTARSYVANLGKVEDITKLREKIVADYGRLDLLINNAGVVFGGGGICRAKDHEIEAMFQINVISQFRMIREFLGDMLKRNHGHIVSISSCSALVGLANASVYCSTKWALNGMMETLYMELKEIPNNKVKVTLVCPYFIDTNPVYTQKWDLRMPPLPVNVVAQDIIDGIEKELVVFSVPSHLYIMLNLMKILPRTLQDTIASIFYTRVLNVSDDERKDLHNVKILESVK